ncbi:MAG: S-layer homology domain-containing protein [Nitriliruptoraceae bacterium]|nr:S-layer homology domain-containing protein [Nitriliruptoraceae bacterium]
MSVVSVRSRFTRRIAVLSTCAAIGAVVAVASAAPADASTRTPVMREAQVSAEQMAAWYRHRVSSGYSATVSIDRLTRYYIEEGQAEGVSGDVAFVQAILETAWFRYPDTGQVRARFNNFGGMGACDGGTCTVAQFPTARVGVRAQIQHLRAYSDPAVTRSNLANPLVSPRFDLVSPKGRAPNWEDYGGVDPRYGGVNWASDPQYSVKILRLYRDLVGFAERNGGLHAAPGYTDVARNATHASDILTMRALGITNGCRDGRTYCPTQRVTRGQMASFLVRAGNIPPASGSRFTDVPRTHTHHDDINALAAAGYTNGCRDGSRYCPDDPITRAEMASFLQRVAGLRESSGSIYADVPASHTHAGAIRAITEAGWTNGCHGGGTYCPSRDVSRQEMASFLRRAFVPYWS